VRLFTIVAEDLLKLCSARLRKQLRRRLAGARVKAKVKKTAGTNPKSPLAVNKLIRRESKVKVDAINLAKPSIGDGACEVCAAPMECGESLAEVSEPYATHFDRATICIDAEQESARPRGLKHRFGMSTTTKVGVNVGAVCAYRQGAEQFCQQDGAMEGRTRRH
jgi:hypothetical protein